MVLNSHYETIVSSSKTEAFFWFGFFGGGDSGGIYLREFFCLFKTTRFNIAVAGDYTSSSWKSVSVLCVLERNSCAKMLCMINKFF